MARDHCISKQTSDNVYLQQKQIFFNVFILPEDAAEPRVDEEAAEGMAEPAVETETVAAATVVAPMDALLRPIARLLTGPRPEGAETVAEPIEEAWGPPNDTCAAATEEEEGTEEGTTGTDEGKEEECRLESPSTLGCYRSEKKRKW